MPAVLFLVHVIDSINGNNGIFNHTELSALPFSPRNFKPMAINFTTFDATA